MRLVSFLAIPLLTAVVAVARLGAIEVPHINGLAFDPRDSVALLVATHTGLPESVPR